MKQNAAYNLFLAVAFPAVLILVALSGGCMVTFAYRNIYTMNPEANDYFGQGVRLSGEGKTDDSIAAYTKSIRISPSAAAYCNRSAEWRRKGRYDDAVSDAGRAIKMIPTYALAYFNRGNARYLNKDYNGALIDYVAALNHDPGRAEYYFNCGLANARTGRAEEAAGMYRKAVEADPRYAAAYYNLACYYSEKKDAGNALKYLDRAVTEGFKDIDMIGNDRALNTIRADKGYLRVIRRIEKILRKN